MRANISPHPDALAYRIDDASQIIGLGRTSLYKLANQGKLRLVKVAGRTLVDAVSLRNLIQKSDQQ